MRVNKKVITAFFVGLIVGIFLSIIFINTTIKKDAEIIFLKDKIEILQSINRSSNIDSSTIRK